jgi:Tfp pilus assembly protein PilF
VRSDTDGLNDTSAECFPSFNSALAIDKEDPQAYANMGTFLQNSNKLEEAIRMFEKAKR